MRSGAVVLVAALLACGMATVPGADEPVQEADGAWFALDWSDYATTADMDGDPTGRIQARMVSGYGPDGRADGEVVLETGLSGTPWGGSHGVRVTYFDRSVVPCSALHGPEVGVRLDFPRAAEDRPREIWYEVWVRFDRTWDTVFCDQPFPEQKFLSLYDDRYNRWNFMVGSAPERWIRAYIDNYDASGARAINAAVPPSSERYLDARTALWDGQWHRIRYHARMGTGSGALNVWIDDQKVFDQQGLTSMDAGAGWFAHLYLGSNLNQRPDQRQSVLFGPVRAWTADPGW